MSRDYNRIKDDLEEAMDEIKKLREELESAKGIVNCQANRHVITASPILVKPNRKDENVLSKACEEAEISEDPGHVDQESSALSQPLPNTQVIDITLFKFT